MAAAPHLILPCPWQSELPNNSVHFRGVYGRPQSWASFLSSIPSFPPSFSSLPIMPSIQLVGHLIPFDIDSAPERQRGGERERTGAGRQSPAANSLPLSLPSLIPQRQQQPAAAAASFPLSEQSTSPSPRPSSFFLPRPSACSSVPFALSLAQLYGPFSAAAFEKRERFCY